MEYDNKGKSYEGCAYIGGGGCVCAVGALIPDGKYRKDMEGEPVSSRVIWNERGLKGRYIAKGLHNSRELDHMRKTLRRLQHWHDNSVTGPEDMKRLFEGILGALEDLPKDSTSQYVYKVLRGLPYAT